MRDIHNMLIINIHGGVIPTMAKDNVLEVMNNDEAMINDLYFICQH